MDEVHRQVAVTLEKAKDIQIVIGNPDAVGLPSNFRLSGLGVETAATVVLGHVSFLP